MKRLKSELDEVMKGITGSYDVIPFMTLFLATKDTEFRSLPPDMLELLRASPDYSSVRPGAQPTWFQIASGNQNAELIIYRAEADGLHYVLAPREKP